MENKKEKRERRVPEFEKINRELLRDFKKSIEIEDEIYITIEERDGLCWKEKTKWAEKIPETMK